MIRMRIVFFASSRPIFQIARHIRNVNWRWCLRSVASTPYNFRHSYAVITNYQLPMVKYWANMRMDIFLLIKIRVIYSPQIIIETKVPDFIFRFVGRRTIYNIQRHIAMEDEDESKEYKTVLPCFICCWLLSHRISNIRWVTSTCFLMYTDSFTTNTPFFSVSTNRIETRVVWILHFRTRDSPPVLYSLCGQESSQMFNKNWNFLLKRNWFSSTSKKVANVVSNWSGLQEQWHWTEPAL